MRCTDAREALSARFDAETTADEARMLAAHVAACPECAAFEASLARLDLVVRAEAAEPPPAPHRLAASVPARVPERGRRVRLGLRLGIALLTVGDLYLALGEMVGRDGHEAHEAGSFVVALCVALGYAAARPALARAYVPVLGIASLLLVVMSAVDVGAGHTTVAHETRHLGLVLATVLLWLLAHTDADRPRWRPAPRLPAVSSSRPRPVLRVVHGGTLARTVRASVALAMAALFLLIPSSASAHAVLESSTPRPDSILTALPAEVSLSFSEAVTLVPSSLRVYGPDGSRADRGDVGHRGGRSQEIGVSLGTDRGQGTYLVSWRVISADSHPVSGAFTFSVGKVSATPDAPAETSSRPLGITLGVARWLDYLGSALLVGGMIVLGWCWRAGWTSPRARRLMLLGGVLLAVGSAACLLLKGPYDAALGPGATFHGDLLREVLATTYGRATLARFALAVVGMLMVWRRVRSLRLAALLGVAVGVSFALAGHAAAGDGRLIAALNDTVHVLAASIWLGGLVLLCAAVLPARDAEASRIAVTRFSGLALVMVVALVATGLYQAIRQVGSLGALTGTAYGRELVVKVGIVIVVLALAIAARRRLALASTRLRAVVAAEAVLVLVVVAISSSLVVTEPARTAYRPIVSAQVTVMGDTVEISAVPAGDRTVELHLYVFGKNGQPSEPKEITASISLPAEDIEALPVTLQNAGPGHRQALVAAPMTGEWRLAITVRTSAIDEATGYVALPIR